MAMIDATGTVVAVHVASDIYSGKEHKLCEKSGRTYRQTSYNTHHGVHYDRETGQPSEDQSKALRKNYAAIGYRYDADRDAFIPPKPFPSAVLNETTCDWEHPVAYPDDGGKYVWNESTTSWDVRTDAPTD